VSIPKDLVIMIDKSQSMATPVGSHDRLHYAITATQAVINSANPNDHVCFDQMHDDFDFCLLFLQISLHRQHK